MTNLPIVTTVGLEPHLELGQQSCLVFPLNLSTSSQVSPSPACFNSWAQNWWHWRRHIQHWPRGGSHGPGREPGHGEMDKHVFPQCGVIYKEAVPGLSQWTEKKLPGSGRDRPKKDIYCQGKNGAHCREGHMQANAVQTDGSHWNSPMENIV